MVFSVFRSFRDRIKRWWSGNKDVAAGRPETEKDPVSSTEKPEIQSVNICEDDIIILVMGPPGCGKSSLINLLRPENPAEVSGSIKVSKKPPTAHRVTLPGDPIYQSKPGRLFLVEAPNFDPFDGELQDRKTFQPLRKWLSTRGVIRAGGILYLNEITANRWESRENECCAILEPIFKEFLGNDFASRLVMVTTMWNDNKMEEDRKTEHEKGRQMHWKAILAQGSHLMRVGDTSQEAIDIVNKILEQHNRGTIREVELASH
ncbi:hypothetical protein FA15DRAFT_674932 [Coprinopsis marcescibilis]|uniref:G domain-containing protein n=1 Tax=Coprinopsis marcescibilis TaxID=230819 RepID=A0A5C3KFQ3_COPMA|nr:hypothetical protein FA15DRAFT_674932 [Coprinopsis marcescibilis]